VDGRVAAALGIVVCVVGLVVGLVALRSADGDDGAEVVVLDSDIQGHPGGVAATRGGRLYFTEQFEDRVGWLDPETGETETVDLPEGTLPHYVLVGADENVWFSGLSGVIGRYDVQTDEVELYRDGMTPGLELHFLLIDPTDDSKLWFTEQRGDRVGVFDTEAEQATEFALPPFSSPHGLAADPDGRSIWVALQGRDRVAEIDLSSPIEDQAQFDAALTEHGGFEEGSGPHDMVFAPDGTMLLTLSGTSELARYAPSSEEVDIFDALLPRETRGQELNTLALSPDATKIVFNMFQSGRIGVLDLESGEVAEIGQELASTSGPIEVIRAPDGTLYCTLVSLSDEPGDIVRIELEEIE
jgi:virginiamycin B lyase